jgi:hypothetical protein
MLGFSFRVYKQQTDSKVPATIATQWGKDYLVRWEGWLDGLKKLEEEGKATCFDNNNFYPNFYTLQLKYLLSIIEKDVELLSSCDEDEYMILEVWDLS